MRDFDLTQEQLAAATASDDHVLILAPPGCGKTEVLARRAADQISLLGPNQRVLALTFTKRARTNLEERLRTALGHTRVQRRVVVRNLHGFATQIVLAHGRTIGLDMETLALPKTSTMRRAMDAAGGGREKYNAERTLSAIKRSPLSDAQVLEEICRQGQGTSGALAEKVEQARQQANQLHYDDLLRHAQRLLRIPAVARLYRAHFGAVLVDEFQDLSLQQLDLALLSCTARRTFAGDPLQGIFSWAGAAPTEVESEIRRTCGEPLRLHESYRSSPRVLESVTSLSQRIDPNSGLTAAVPEQWTDGGCSAALTFQDRALEANSLRDLAGAILERTPKASIGFITRSRWRNPDIVEAFDAPLPYSVRRWDFAIDDPSTIDLIKSVVTTLPRGATIADARVATLKTLDPSDVDSRELIDDAFETLESSDANTIRAALSSIKASDPKQPVGPGVHLLTAHAGKGQQFDWVFVIGLEEGHLPDWRSKHGDALSEEQRVALVMLSRARHGLILTRSLVGENRRGKFRAEPSRWWAEIKTQHDSIDDVKRHIGGYGSAKNSADSTIYATGASR